MSESRLVQCAGCGRHIVAGDTCPFCGQPGEPLKGGYGFDPKPGDALVPRTPLQPPVISPEEAQRMVAPRYGMPPWSPTHPAGVMRLVLVLMLVVGPVLIWLRFLRH